MRRKPSPPTLHLSLPLHNFFLPALEKSQLPIKLVSHNFFKARILPITFPRVVSAISEMRHHCRMDQVWNRMASCRLKSEKLFSRFFHAMIITFYTYRNTPPHKTKNMLDEVTGDQGQRSCNPLPQIWSCN